jgi:rhodanese-related sulfurtransferase
MNTTTANLNTPDKAEEFFAGKLDFTISPVELNEQIENGGKNFIVDVRTTKDFIKGHVPNAINLPQGMCDKITGWRNDRTVIVYGYSYWCHLAARTAMLFARQGHSVMEMEGGFEAWKSSRLPMEA